GADDDRTSFSVNDVSISEGGLMTFTVSRSGDAEASQSIDFATNITGADTAESADFTGKSGTLTFAAGVTSQTFTVQTSQDSAYEGGETFTVTLANNSAGSIISDATGVGTILDDGSGPGPFDPGPGADDDRTGFRVNDVSISEGGLITFTVSRNGDTSASQTVDFATSIAGGNSAEAGDFTATNGTLTFAAGVTSQTFTVQTVQDNVFEGAETFTVTLANNSAGSTISDATGMGTILDDGTGPGPFDPGPGADDDRTIFRVNDVSISEGGLMTFTVSRSGNAGASQTVDFATSITGGNTAEAGDFSGKSGTLTFATGVTSQTFTVQTSQDNIFEGAETFTVTLANNSIGTSIADATGVGTILDDGSGPGPYDPGPGADDDRTSFRVNDLSISEGGLMTFTVSRNGDAEASQTVDFTTSIVGGNTAETGDFAGKSGTLTFAAGVTSQTFTVQTSQDSVYEGAETFTVTLANSSAGSTISDATGMGTILDDGTGPGPFNPGPGADDDRTSFRVNDVSISEGGLMTFTVGRNGDAEASQTVDFATSISGGNSAEAGDFTGKSGTLTFAAGVTHQTFTVQTSQDNIYEGGETFTVTLANNSAGSTISDPTGVGTILDDGTGPGPFNPGPSADDDRTSFSVNEVTVSEGGLMTFTVSRQGDAEASQTIDFATSIGGADTAEGDDFTATSGTLTFAPGVASRTFTVQTNQDSAFEGAETLTATLANNSAGSTISDASGRGTILDDGTGPDPDGPGPLLPDDDRWYPVISSLNTYIPDVIREQHPDIHHDSLYLYVLPSSQVALTNETSSFNIPSGMFRHTDSNARLKYDASLVGGGPLPLWLIFDPATGRFTGVPPEGSNGVLDIRITASDQMGNTASAQFALYIIESKNTPLHVNTSLDSNFGTIENDLIGKESVNTGGWTGRTGDRNNAASLDNRSDMSQKTYGQDLAELASTSEVLTDTTTTIHLPAGLFRHPGQNAIVSISATLSNGKPLPEWLVFDSANESFVINAPGNMIGALDLRIVARDNYDYEISTQLRLELKNKLADIPQGEKLFGAYSLDSESALPQDSAHHLPEGEPVKAAHRPMAKGRASLSEQLASANQRNQIPRYSKVYAGNTSSRNIFTAKI
ncbi:MAG: hypothetical protein HGA96_17030, partial [Desulfobulbaceae bacterium]|nr:hypothetical protein [Desulfobulbaceae bacterium]